MTANGNKSKSEHRRRWFLDGCIDKPPELKEGDVLTEADLTLDDRLDDRVLSEEERLAEERRQRSK